MVAPAVMIERAFALEKKGLLRRAGTLWRNVLKHPLAKDNEFELARKRLLNPAIAVSQAENRDLHSPTPHRLNNIEEDREKILSLLKKGATVKEVMFITRRSQSYVYSCKKLLQSKI